VQNWSGKAHLLFTAPLPTMKKISNLKQAAALLLVAGACGAFAPNANAATTAWTGGTAPFTGGATEGGATFTGISVGGGGGQFTFDSPMANFWTTSLNFNPGYNNSGTAEEFRYTLTDSNPFTAAGLTSQMQAGLPGANFSKNVCSDGFNAGNCVLFTTANTASDKPDGTLKPLVGFGTTIYVVDTYTSTNGNSQITGITNSFTTAPQTSKVPGPLPLLGAGAAFGFSRKLRNRVKLAA